MKNSLLKDRILKNYKIANTYTLKGRSGVVFTIYERESELYKLRYFIVCDKDLFLAHVVGITSVFQVITAHENDTVSRYTKEDLKCIN